MPHVLAGKPAPRDLLINIAQLEKDYYTKTPDTRKPSQRVSFGTSGHRGKPADGSFNESHVLAIVQAICDYRAERGYTGTLFLGKDTHAASNPAQRTALEVLAANKVSVCYQEEDGYTPTPVISHAILTHNHNRKHSYADGIVITPSHNPPSDGGIKYNPPNGGPADTDVTTWIQDRANKILGDGNKSVAKLDYEAAIKTDYIIPTDFVTQYVADLHNIVDMKIISISKIRIGVDPLGGAGTAYWKPIAKAYDLDITLVNDRIDPTFSFMTVDHDGKIRMDCSSPYAMQGLVAMKDKFDIAFANDPDTDRHGIVTPSVGLLNPNYYLAVAINYLYRHRPGWSESLGIGKTLVSSAIIDRVASDLGRSLVEVPVGFKWFVDGLYEGTIGFGGEESAGASFLRSNGKVWTTDKDGIILNLLAAEILAVTNEDPGKHYQEIESKFGKAYYTRVDQPANAVLKDKLKNLSPVTMKATELAGDKIASKITKASGNNAAIGGLKVTTQNGWFAARPSGTEDICKVYAESFVSETHLNQIIKEAGEIIENG
ncbi:MAG: phosphoglucomutase (alpha-D-glucose-1,6-bisphosphate-dependent) [Planctomycetaceae bacterium]|nr:phosphoglucomutase (alpha-D-glucose-1,6-bisphosphate-dependent) [Planctomycetaceae bacterium]